MLAIGTTLVALGARNAYWFLAASDRLPGGALVVEGWIPDYALAEVLVEYKRGFYEKVFVTGGPVEQGAYLVAYKTYAEVGAATLLKLGLPPHAIQPVPGPPIQQDRTYASALALKHWLHEHNAVLTNLNLVSFGAHSRRSRLLLATALGTDCRVGNVTVADRGFDPTRWWASSPGVRVVIAEMIAYVYARVGFTPRER